MAGYDWNNGMSNNAVGAYSRGLMPISKAASELAELAKAKGFKITVAKARDILEEQGAEEWHHSSKYYNRVDFFDAEKALKTLRLQRIFSARGWTLECIQAARKRADANFKQHCLATDFGITVTPDEAVKLFGLFYPNYTSAQLCGNDARNLPNNYLEGAAIAKEKGITICRQDAPSIAAQGEAGFLKSNVFELAEFVCSFGPRGGLLVNEHWINAAVSSGGKNLSGVASMTKPRRAPKMTP